MSDQAARDALRQWMASRSDPPPYAWKVAINFPDGQRRLGLTRALAAPLFREQRHASGSALSCAVTSKLFVEAEIAIRLARDLDRALPLQELRDCIEAYAPCLELVDYAQPGQTVPELLPHAFFHAGIVLGALVPAALFGGVSAPFPRAESSQGKLRERVIGVVAEDLAAVLQPVAELALFAGSPLRRGQLVLCGSYIEPVGLRAGDSVHVDYGPELAPLSVSRAS